MKFFVYLDMKCEKTIFNWGNSHRPQQKRYFFYLDAGMLWDRNKNYVRNEWNPISKTSCCTIKNETRSFIFNNAKDKRNPILPRILTMFALLSTSENDMRSKYLCVYQAVGYFIGHYLKMIFLQIVGSMSCNLFIIIS